MSVSALYLARPLRLWTMPWRVVRAIRDQRTMIPSPLIYMAALVVGALVGVALDALLGWPWWISALAFLVLVWLAFLSTAFIGPMPGPSLRDELLDAIHPMRAPERRERREAELIRTRPFPLYGLDSSWTGLRLLGGHGFRGRMLTSVELTHGDPRVGPWVRVETAPVWPRRPLDLQDVATDLWWGMEQHPPPNLPPAERQAWIDRRVQERRARNTEWTRVSILVEGELTEFDLLDETSDWAAHGIIGGLVVTLQAHQFPIGSVRLETVTDVERYIEGSRRFFEEQRKLHEDEEN